MLYMDIQHTVIHSYLRIYNRRYMQIAENCVATHLGVGTNWLVGL